jgi:hypothetical protein
VAAAAATAAASSAVGARTESFGGAVRVFRHHFALEDAIGTYACSLQASSFQANTRGTNDIPLGSPPLIVVTMNYVETLKALVMMMMMMGPAIIWTQTLVRPSCLNPQPSTLNPLTLSLKNPSEPLTQTL